MSEHLKSVCWSMKFSRSIL